jgi:hypothetical protein
MITLHPVSDPNSGPAIVHTFSRHFTIKEIGVLNVAGQNFQVIEHRDSEESNMHSVTAEL